MKRHRKNSASIRRFGKGYESGKCSASNLGNTDDEDVGDHAVPTSSQDVEVCGKCGKGESDVILDD